jgi:hypothetical protein
MSALILLLLLVCCACTRTEYIQIRPDPSLTAPTPEPQIRGQTWRDVGEAWLQCRAAVRQCNADKAAIRGEIPEGD